MRKLAFLPIAAVLTTAPTTDAASGCDPVIAATLKVFQVPAHLYMTETGAKTRNVETIYLNAVTYVKVNRPWLKSTVSPKDLMEAQMESEKGAGPCGIVREEDVGGEAATLYKVHYQSTDETVDAQIWISKSRGLPLKQINDRDVGAAGKRHTEVRYEYTNVTVPILTEPRRK